MAESRLALTNLSSLQLDKVLYKLQLAAPEGYDEDGKLELLRCNKVFSRAFGDYEDEDIIAVFNKKGTFADFETSDGKGFYGGQSAGPTFFTFGFFTTNMNHNLEKDFISEILSSLNISALNKGVNSSVRP